MWTIGERIRCECGKQYTLVVDPDERPTMRCHMCGRLIDLSFVKRAAAEKAAADQTRVHNARVAEARQANFGGLRFDGLYRTPEPVPFDGCLAAAFDLSFRFADNLEAEYAFRALDHDQGSIVEVESDSGRTVFSVANGKAIQVTFDTGVWVCEWEGVTQGDKLLLSYRIEEYAGLSSGPKCVREGDSWLQFERILNGE